MAGRPWTRAREAASARGDNPDDVPDPSPPASSIALYGARERRPANVPLRQRIENIADRHLGPAIIKRVDAGSDQVIIWLGNQVLGSPVQAVKVQQDPAGILAELGASILARAAAEGLLLPIDIEEPNP